MFEIRAEGSQNYIVGSNKEMKEVLVFLYMDNIQLVYIEPKNSCNPEDLKCFHIGDINEIDWIADKFFPIK